MKFLNLSVLTTIQDIADNLGISKGTVSNALNGASDISETLQKQILETAVELGYTKLRRQKGCAKKLCVLVENQNIEYEEPHHFAYDIIMGFRQKAEPAGFDVPPTTYLCCKITTSEPSFWDFPIPILGCRTFRLATPR